MSKPRLVLVLTLLSLGAGLSAQVNQKSTNNYLGQKPPGEVPEVFAPGVVSKGDVHGRLAISPDSKEMCWTSLTALSAEGVAHILCVTNENGRWTSPAIPAFAAHVEAANPLFSPDGARLFFESVAYKGEGFHTRYVEKKHRGWSKTKTDGFLLNTTSSFTRSGNVYFSDVLTDKPWNTGIYSAQYTARGYRNTAALGATVNSAFIDYTPYISSDESYLLFSSSRPSMREEMFLQISFKQKDGAWAVPLKLNEAMGFAGNARFPSISPDEKYLFFCGDDGNIYWVDIKVVEKLRPRE